MTFVDFNKVRLENLLHAACEMYLEAAIAYAQSDKNEETTKAMEMAEEDIMRLFKSVRNIVEMMVQAERIREDV